MGVPGSPDIAISIFAKIASADIFVADVSIINNIAEGARPTPNPNVLFELGYAVAELGWENVMLVMNTEFGGPDLLPFDLRGRRVTTYAALDGGDNTEAKRKLGRTLESVVREQLSSGEEGNLPTGRGADLWWGEWNLQINGATGGRLFISEIGPDGFLFDLRTWHGSHTGTVQSAARIVSRDLAYARISDANPDGDGELIFRRSRVGAQRQISIEESVSCQNYHGMRGFLSGTFVNRPEPWFDAEVMSELDLSRIYSLVGGYFEQLRDCSSDIHVEEAYDQGTVRVVTGGVAGLYTIMESIVLIGENSRMCCAFIDGDVVRFFANRRDWFENTPEAVGVWKSRFPEMELVREYFKSEAPL